MGGVRPQFRRSSRTPTSFSTLPCLKKTSVGTGRRSCLTRTDSPSDGTHLWWSPLRSRRTLSAFFPVEQLLNCVYFLVRMKSGSKAQADLGGKGSPASFCAWDGLRGDSGLRNRHCSLLK